MRGCLEVDTFAEAGKPGRVGFMNCEKRLRPDAHTTRDERQSERIYIVYLLARCTDRSAETAEILRQSERK